MSSGSSNESLLKIEEAVINTNVKNLEKYIQQHEKDSWFLPSLVDMALEFSNINTLKYLVTRGAKLEGMENLASSFFRFCASNFVYFEAN